MCIINAMTEEAMSRVRDMANGMDKWEKDLFLKTWGVDPKTTISLNNLYYLVVKDRFTNELKMATIIYDDTSNLSRVKECYSRVKEDNSIGQVHGIFISVTKEIKNKPEVILEL